MKFQSLVSLLLPAICLQFVPATVAQEPPAGFTNADLIAYAKKAATLVTDIQPSGELVLPVNYFHEAFRKEFKVSALRSDGTIDEGAEPGTMSLTQDDKKLVVCTLLAEAMLEVAKPDGQTAAQYSASWIGIESKVLDLKVGDVLLMSDLRIKSAWQQFLKEWRDKVLATDSDRFRDALRQAAYSLVRAGLDIEKEHVDRVLAGTATPTGGSGGGGTSSATSGEGRGGGYRHVDVHHERLMNGIYRRHDRRMYKIDRIRARR